MQKTPIINQELRDLLPPLSPKQLEKLESEIKQDGCTSPLTLWNDILVDGHNRYDICTKNKIEYRTVQKEFASFDEAKLWMWTHQDGQRNLTAFGRVKFALKIKDIIALQSKERQRAAGGDRKSNRKKSLPQNSAEAIRSKETRQLLAEFANVSHDTVDRVEYILAHADKDTINALYWEKRGISINKVFNNLKAAIQSKQPKPTKPQEPKPAKKNSKTTASLLDVTELAEEKQTSKHPAENKAPESQVVATEQESSFRTGLYCRPGEKPGASGEPYVTKSSLTDLPHDQPEVLVAQLIAHFPRDYARKCPFLIFDALRANDGRETILPLVRAIIEEFGDQ